LVVSADVPPQDGETDEQRQELENANAARAVRLQQEIAAAAQVPANNQVNNRSSPDRSTTTPGNKHMRHRLPLSNDATTIHLVPTEYVQETSSGTSSAMALKFTTIHNPTWEPLLPP
jgi:type II secretory pathway pseudopilin PulG